MAKSKKHQHSTKPSRNISSSAIGSPATNSSVTSSSATNSSDDTNIKQQHLDQLQKILDAPLDNHLDNKKIGDFIVHVNSG
ncbi:hypothetical protein [Candidatus Tisiphia endosymbiont of Ditula angustiorana]|uniref:hypothetical protein n=1 Tax=Candidatus Tisiphia endosymbiont of Ditula angustiorana TaxID=3066272 RepID=UPI00312C9701